MKQVLDIKRQPLPYYKEAALGKTVNFSAAEHGYKFPFWYGIIRLKDHVLQVVSRNFPWNRARITMQRWRGVHIGKNIHWGQGVSIDNTFPYFVTIEDGVSLAGMNYILSHNKPLYYHRNCSESYVAPVVIRKNAWIAVNVTILPGVEIGEGAIVAAGSIVNKDVPAFTLVGGIPAKVIKDMAPKLKDNYSETEFNGIMAQRFEKFKI